MYRRSAHANFFKARAIGRAVRLPSFGRSILFVLMVLFRCRRTWFRTASVRSLRSMSKG